MRSSDDEVLRFLSQLKNKSIFFSGSGGPLRAFFLHGVVDDATLQTFTTRVIDPRNNDLRASVTFDLSEGEFSKTVSSARGREAWAVRFPDNDVLLSLEELL
ncbi:MAG TPA: hypothetical protein VJX30_16755 [Terriglobales bacterium]|nr:hypothetical protein [Terriglobales bacterium]